MKKILLFADVGGHESEEYYHVGDEAMLYETYRWYKENHADWQISILSWFPNHQDLDCAELPHLHWARTQRSFYFPILCLKLLLWRIGIQAFSKKELALVTAIQEHDVIHFCGGGNLSSQFRQWLYYSFFVILTAKVCKKKIFLTSQTIGPISGIDRFFSFFFLNLPNIIALRAQTSRWIQCMKYGAIFPRIFNMIDAAYTLPGRNIKFLNQSKKEIVKIGLSLHDWKGWEEKGQSLIADVLSLLSKNVTIELILIPHHLEPNVLGRDISYMKQLAARIPATIKIHIPNQVLLVAPGKIPAIEIKKLTGQVDFLITTRYHGIIFALSQGIPTIALNYDDYYQEKNNGALKMLLGERWKDSQVLANSPYAKSQLHRKILKIIHNMKSHNQKHRLLKNTAHPSVFTLNDLLRKVL